MPITGNRLIETLQTLGQQWESPEDWLRLDYVGDLFVITIVRRKSGLTERLFFRNSPAGSGDVTCFNPMTLSRQERNQFIRSLYLQRVSQRQIAEMLGITQQAVSHICRY